MNKNQLSAPDTLSEQSSHLLNSNFANFFIDATVNIFYWIFKALLRPFRGSTSIQLSAADIVPGKKYIIASNHQSVLDPFLITSHIPFAAWVRLKTLRYFLANYVFDMKGVRPIVVSLGFFPAKVHETYPYGLLHGINQLNAGRGLVIFPEGQRAIRNEPRTRRGIQVLAQEPEAMVIPAHIEWTKHSKWHRSFAFGIGKPFDASKHSAEEIMKIIYALPIK